MKERTVLLEALSSRQRRLVERHLPLVYLTINRTRRLVWDGHVGREYRDLVQEGMLALVHAIRTHDARRHGHFAAFAMARVHFAISRFAHEHESAVRVPYIEQRRQCRRRRAGTKSHDPGEAPRRWRRHDLHNECELPRSRILSGRTHPDVNPFDESLSEAIRDRCTEAMSSAMKALARRQYHTDDLPRLIAECYEHRWSIPEPDERTSLRDLARRVGSSTAQIIRLEAAFYRHTAEFLTEGKSGDNGDSSRGQACEESKV